MCDAQVLKSKKVLWTCLQILTSGVFIQIWVLLLIHTHKPKMQPRIRRALFSTLLNNKTVTSRRPHCRPQLLQHFSGENHQRGLKTQSLGHFTDVYLKLHSDTSSILSAVLVYTTPRLFGCSSGSALYVRFIFRILQGLERNLTPHSHCTVTWLSQIRKA